MHSDIRGAPLCDVADLTTIDGLLSYFMRCFGDETKCLADTERVQKELENEPDMALMTILLEKLDDLQKQAERMDMFKMDRAIDKIMPTLGFTPEDNDRLVASFSGGWQGLTLVHVLACREHF
jgi:ATPase subunit of ABC transporter with duplicated ATPase domains